VRAAETTGEVVRLTVPASLEFIRIVRLTGSGLAIRLGLDVEGIENLRVALDELASIAIQVASGDLDLEFRTTDTELHITGRAPVDLGTVVVVDGLTSQVLKAVIDDYELTNADGYVSFRCVVRRPTR